MKPLIEPRVSVMAQLIPVNNTPYMYMYQSWKMKRDTNREVQASAE